MGTNIEWTDETLNVTSGCSKISDGCTNCYAERMSKRLAGRFGYSAHNPFQVTLHPDKLERPFHWKKSRRVFVASMSDLFHDDIPLDYISAVFGMMAANPRHTFQLLTKRPKRMLEFFRHLDSFKDGDVPQSCECAYQLLMQEAHNHPDGFSGPIHCKYGPNPDALWPLPNVHIGVTAENQAMANERIPLLLQTPAANRFVSCEPLLGPILLNLATDCDKQCNEYQEAYCPGTTGKCVGQMDLDQIIVGAETGTGKRPMDLDWARDIRDQCIAADVPFFFKKNSNRLHALDGKIHEGMIE